MKNENGYDDKAQSWLDKINNEKPSWFKITKDIIKSFLNGETVELEGLEVKISKACPTHPYDIALAKYVQYKYFRRICREFYDVFNRIYTMYSLSNNYSSRRI